MLGRHLCFAPVTSSVIVDGAVIVQMLKLAAGKNFAEYASEIFIPYIILQLHSEFILSKPPLHDLRGHLNILIRTVDTDVVLAVSVAETLGPEYEHWLAFGTGKHFRYFHTLTGCDTVSSFVGHGKKTAWTIWKALPELTDAMLTLPCAPRDIGLEVMQVIERFIILL